MHTHTCGLGKKHHLAVTECWPWARLWTEDLGIQHCGRQKGAGKMNRLEHIPVDRRTEIRSQPLLRQRCAFKPLAGCQPLSKGDVNILSHSYNSLSHTLPLPTPPTFSSLHPPSVSCSLTFLAMRGFSGLSFTDTVSLYSGMRSRSRGRLTVTIPVWDVPGRLDEQAPSLRAPPTPGAHALPTVPR